MNFVGKLPVAAALDAMAIAASAVRVYLCACERVR